MKKQPQNKEPEFQRIPPQAIEVEMTVLGSILIDELSILKAMELLTEDCFYKSAHRPIFHAMHSLFANNQHIDIITVPEKLKAMGTLDDAGGAYYISELAGLVSSSAGIEHYCEILKEKAFLRNAIVKSTNIVNYSYAPEATSADCLVMVNEISQNETIHKASIVSIMEVAGKASDEVINRCVANQQGKEYGIKTGFYALDKMIGGLKRKKYIVLAARPSMGKSSLAFKIAYNVASAKYPVGIISLEMGADEIIEWMIAFAGTIPAEKIRDGLLTEPEMIHFNRIAGRIADLPIYFTDDFNINAHQLTAKAKLLKAKHDIQLLIIDYLQLIQWTSKKDNENQALSEITRTLKQLAGTLNIPIILISQLNREVTKRANPQPRNSDLRGSGSIEQDADIVIFLWRKYIIERDNDEDATDDSEANLFISKQRAGRIGGFKLGFIPDYVNFVNLEDKAIYEIKDPANYRNEPNDKDIPF
ncbi:MAG: replicative DNA helicase [bacterium]